MQATTIIFKHIREHKAVPNPEVIAKSKIANLP
jgi:hypothetical protein